VAIEIQLSEEQLAIAVAEATRRQTMNEKRGLKGRNRAPAKGDAALELHMLGCTGEAAVAAFLGLEHRLFEGDAPVRGDADLPGKVEVKARKKHGYDLLIQLSDVPEKLFVLTTCDRTVDPSRVKLVGWTYGGPVMLKQYIREFVRGRPCYAVPNHLLQPMETLKDELRNPSQPNRALCPDEAWITKNGKDLILNISQNLADELGLEVGMTLDVIPGLDRPIVILVPTDPNDIDRLDLDRDQ
jgi:hypothetical protein